MCSSHELRQEQYRCHTKRSVMPCIATRSLWSDHPLDAATSGVCTCKSCSLATGMDERRMVRPGNFALNELLSGPTATDILSRYTFSLHSVALRFPEFGGVARESHYSPSKGPVAPTFSALNGGVALQVASWKVSQYREVSQLHCRLSVGHPYHEQVIPL